jgi:hypothetical protein
MRHTFYTEDFSSVEHALARMKELVNEMTGDPNPCFGIEEGDAGYCIFHTSTMHAYTDKTFIMTILVYFTEVHGATVEGFFTH